SRYVQCSGAFDAPGGVLAMPGEWSSMIFNARGGTLGFVAWSEGHAAASVTTADLESTATIEVPMQAGSADELEGAGRRGDRPMSGVEVALLARSPMQWGLDDEAFVDAVRTSADGTFRLAAAPGSYVLRVRADDAPFLQEMHFTDQPNGWWTVAIP